MLREAANSNVLGGIWSFLTKDKNLSGSRNIPSGSLPSFVRSPPVLITHCSLLTDSLNETSTGKLVKFGSSLLFERTSSETSQPRSLTSYFVQAQSA